MTKSLNDLEAKIAALERDFSGLSESGDSSEGVIQSSESDDAESSSGYSCDSSSSEESELSDSADIAEPVVETDKRKIELTKKADQITKKKQRAGMSEICFKFLTGKCKLDDCVFQHIPLESLNEEEKGKLVRELHKKPFEADLGALVKQLNIPVCKSFSKQGECKFKQCRFWHVDTENVARWAGSPFWCGPCRKAFTGEAQLREHSNGKLHKSQVGNW